jgi:hypothetical protein
MLTSLVVLLAISHFAPSLKTGKLTDFILPGHVILDTASGDMNGDKLSDLILIQRSLQEDQEDYEDRLRPALILFGQIDGSYKLVARNDSIVYGKHDGGVFGDPWAGITIAKGNFSLEFYGGSAWRWVWIVTFKYDKKREDFFLYRDGVQTFHTSEPDKLKENIQSRKQYGKLRFASYRHRTD